VSHGANRSHTGRCRPRHPSIGIGGVCAPAVDPPLKVGTRVGCVHLVRLIRPGGGQVAVSSDLPFHAELLTDFHTARRGSISMLKVSSKKVSNFPGCTGVPMIHRQAEIVSHGPMCITTSPVWFHEER
jgi:hypothetical protein